MKKKSNRFELANRNIEQAKLSLETERNNKPLKIKLKDKSVYTYDAFREKALKIKVKSIKSLTLKKALAYLKKTTEGCWKRKTIPSRFGYLFPWDTDYKNMAEVYGQVSYAYLRGILMSLMFTAATSGTKGIVLLDDNKAIVIEKEKVNKT